MDADDFPATASPLRLARKAAGVSPTTFARRAGVARALGVKPAALVGWEPLEVAA